MEGPQTHALADSLAASVVGHPVERINVPQGRWQANVLLHNCVGQVIQRTRAHGRWLFLDFSHGVTWATQLIAKSTWTVRPADQPESLLPGQPLLSINLRSSQKAYLTGRPIFLILPTETLPQHTEFKTLGPDPLTSADYEIEFPQRIRRAAGRTVAAALLDQDILAGVGNPLKCEILFATNIAPSTRVGDLLSSHVQHLVEATAKTYRDATTAARRNEPFDYSVYDRAGEPCPKCGTDIAVTRSSDDTWFCPSCQPPLTTTTLFS